MANLFLQQRISTREIGKNWLIRFIKRQDELVANYLRKYDYQRARYKDLEILAKWFQLVETIIQKYGIVAEDIYNFDETGF
jgi:hypothetical protein